MILSQGRFDHCPSICIHDGQPVIAWYAGSWECRDDQSIVVALPNRESSIKLEDKSGNPIVVSHGGRLHVLYGKFRSPSKGMDRWSSCLFRLQELEISNGRLVKIGKPKTLTSKQGWLARCNPIVVNNEIIVPIYYEGKTKRFSFCAVSKLDIESKTLKVTSIIEQNSPAIQPTIWHDGKQFTCLARNFSMAGSRNPYAKYAVSKNLVEWSVFKDSRFFNDNNSIATFSSDKNDYVLWNDCPKGRSNMTLGQVEIGLGLANTGAPTLKNSAVVDLVGAYPNGVAHNGELHIVYQTKHDGNNVIKYIVVNEESFNDQQHVQQK